MLKCRHAIHASMCSYFTLLKAVESFNDTTSNMQLTLSLNNQLNGVARLLLNQNHLTSRYGQWICTINCKHSIWILVGCYVDICTDQASKFRKKVRISNIAINQFNFQKPCNKLLCQLRYIIRQNVDWEIRTCTATCNSYVCTVLSRKVQSGSSQSVVKTVSLQTQNKQVLTKLPVHHHWSSGQSAS